jgi:antitoxin component of RelBE/YafQ-DinJ toxin-antitoxin module
MSKPETFTLRIETELLEEARRVARERGVKVSALIREGLLNVIGGRRKPRPRRSEQGRQS